MINIVLYQPQIPPNTGNIARLCVCNDFCLHLIHPLGFSLDEKQLKRAGLDYWEHLHIVEHANWEAFENSIPHTDSLYFFSSKHTKDYWEPVYKSDPYLVFGSETHGLPDSLHKKYPEQFFTIPMYGKHKRCLNLSNSVSIVAYEVVRQEK
jgi:tRNA (cytidine/uridine-2'-O-)-methyltransferase